ncbi:hypothetical protein G3O08_07400 [Cryomorpha ignava]|uniref:Prenyltransferase n=1 Tax=Cryomorpha ignava TaxID=101383 RepID=A0A7K3WR49_9FLAO|nr:hypothetical protein [Cryomorpha ignava]NEN23322.1 hypothetical protein [Cryomorpha ignava]
MKSESSISRALFWLGETNIFIAFAAGACTLATYAFHDVAPSYNLVAFIFFATLLIYNLQRRIGDLNASAVFYKSKTILMILGAIGLIPFAFHLTLIELAGLAVAGAISLGYAYPFIPYKGERYSIRRIPYLKLWVIVLAWILSTTIVPLIEIVDLNSADDRLSTILFALQQGAFILALTIPFDVRDLEDDYPFQRTLPMVFGIEWSIKFAQRAMIAAFLFAFFNYLIGFFAFPQMLMQMGISALGFFVVARGKTHRSPLYYSIVLDGMILLQGLLVLAV